MRNLRMLLTLTGILFYFYSNAKVVEVPFVELPTGQMAVQVKMSGVEGEHYFIFESAGDNLLRNDMLYRLDAIGMDTLNKAPEFDTIYIGDAALTGNTKFKMKSKLGKRSEYAFPPSVLGTISTSVFKGKVVQVNYQDHKLVIADDIEEVTASADVQRVAFTYSFLNQNPTIEVSSRFFKQQDISIEFSLPLELSVLEVSASIKTAYSNMYEDMTTTFDGETTLIVTTSKIDELYLNSEMEFNDVTAFYSNKITPCLGNVFLRNFVVTLDMNNGYVYFDPATERGHQMLKPQKEGKKKKAPKKFIPIQ